ncbi:hypothetical protein FACS1894127_6650 [Clostridia bacterium]|nr:hypothetical protein FACS1894127_6650 [Clostridia bacterium]
MKTIRVLIVDDSILFREALSRELRKDSQIEVVGSASDPFDASEKIMAFKPDVLVLDVEMPKMDGIEFLKRLLPQYPIPVVMSSSISGTVFEALAAGAVDFVAKPDRGRGMDEYARDLRLKIKEASEITIRVKSRHDQRFAADTHPYDNRTGHPDTHPYDNRTGHPDAHSYDNRTGYPDTHPHDNRTGHPDAHPYDNRTGHPDTHDTESKAAENVRFGEVVCYNVHTVLLADYSRA